VRSPNPEEKDALTLAIEQAKAENADIVIGTDPDCDRVGVGVLHGGDYVLLTGNQTGALLVDFVLKFKKDSLHQNAAVVKTIVTSGLGAAIAEKYGAKVFQTLTGFKYIGEKICLWEESGENTFVFGYEESYGYLSGTHARDKDAVVASMLIAEMASYYKNNGMTLVDALDRIYAEYGYYYDCLETFVLKGKEGAEKIQSAMQAMRESGENLFDDLDVLLDYSKGIDGLPKENVLRFDFKDGSWAAARPSGTEPKLKLYFSVKGENKEQATVRQQAIRNVLADKIYG
jgi:phosphoglucomutase